MQKISFFILILILISSCAKEEKKTDVKIYYIDHELFMLVGMPDMVEGESVCEQAERILDKLVLGQDFNRKIKRQIPKKSGLMSVRIEDSCAVVDLSEEFIRLHEDSRIAERFTVYQIVNSLASLDGINSVRFTIAGNIKKDFKGYLDMRETFFPKPYVL